MFIIKIWSHKNSTKQHKNIPDNRTLFWYFSQIRKILINNYIDTIPPKKLTLFTHTTVNKKHL